MIIAIMDIENNHKEGAAVTALLAGITSVAKSKKTLALQLNGFTQDSIVNILYGKQLAADSIRDVYTFSDDGLDALLLRAETNNLSKEHYDECVTALLDKENMLDVLKPTGRNSLLEFDDLSTIETVIKNAEDVYDYIYIYLPMSEKTLYEHVTLYTDAELVIVPQGVYPEIDLSNPKTNIVVKDFEPDSKFDIAVTRKKFRVPKIYTIPHNVGLKDALIDCSLLDFILVNRNNIKSDDNYLLTSSLLNLLTLYMTGKYDNDSNLENELHDKDNKIILEGEEATVLRADSVQEVTVKKGLFRKEKKFIVDI